MNRRIFPRVVTLSAIALVAVVAAGCSSMSGAMDGMKGAMGMGKPAPAKLVDGVYVGGANGINSEGAICGSAVFGSRRNQVQDGYLLIPAP